jgi:hypothetical protein
MLVFARASAEAVFLKDCAGSHCQDRFQDIYLIRHLQCAEAFEC